VGVGGGLVHREDRVERVEVLLRCGLHRQGGLIPVCTSRSCTGLPRTPWHIRQLNLGTEAGVPKQITSSRRLGLGPRVFSGDWRRWSW
jgi:hypothetical protein